MQAFRVLAILGVMALVPVTSKVSAQQVFATNEVYDLYDVSIGDDSWTWTDFGQEAIECAVGGAVGGAVACGAAGAATGAAAGAVAGAAAYAAGQAWDWLMGDIPAGGFSRSPIILD